MQDDHDDRCQADRVIDPQLYVDQYIEGTKDRGTSTGSILVAVGIPCSTLNV